MSDCAWLLLVSQFLECLPLLYLWNRLLNPLQPLGSHLCWEKLETSVNRTGSDRSWWYCRQLAVNWPYRPKQKKTKKKQQPTISITQEATSTWCMLCQHREKSQKRANWHAFCSPWAVSGSGLILSACFWLLMVIGSSSTVHLSGANSLCALFCFVFFVETPPFPASWVMSHRSRFS